MLDWLFGCSHSRTTFPQSPKGGQQLNATRVVCLDCGKEFAYDWSRMRIGPAVQPTTPWPRKPTQEQIA